MRVPSLFLIAAVLLGAVVSARAQSGVVLGVEAPLADLDPARRSPNAPTLASLLHAPLLRLDLTTAEMDKSASMLASFTVQAGQEWILDLKPDLKFSDGTPIDAAVVVTNIKRILATKEPGLLTPHLEGLLYNIAVVSPTRIKMTLSRPHMSLLYVLSSPRAGIVSPKSLLEGFQGTALAGSGPYRLVKRGIESLELEANPHYVVGSPRIPKVTVKRAPPGTSRLMWLLAGQGHLVEGLTEEDAKRALELAGCASLETPGLGGVGVYIDTTRPPFDATWMCDAFFQAFDSSAIAPWLYERRVSTARRALPASAWANPPGTSIPVHNPEAAKSAVESGVTVGRPTSFILGVALEATAVAPADLEPMLARLRWGFLEAGFTVLTEPITGDPTPALSRTVAPQAVLFSYGAMADDPGLLIGEMVARQKAPIFKRLELGPEPGTLLEKVGTAVQLEAHRFLYESIGTQIGDTKRLAFVAHPVRRVTFVTGLQGLRLGADGAVDLDAAEFIER